MAPSDDGEWIHCLVYPRILLTWAIEFMIFIEFGSVQIAIMFAGNFR